MAKTLKIHASTGESNPTPASKSGTISPTAALFWGALATGLAMRVLELGLRPLHHDESIHATFAFQWMDAPGTSYYKYDPTYHGPFLYIVTRFLFSCFGVGTIQARLFPLIFGTAVVFTPLLFRKWLGNIAAWCAVILLAVSPLNVYYSRFLAHDMPSLLFAASCAAAVLMYLEQPATGAKWLLLAAGSLGLLFSVKAVSFLYVFIFASAGIFWVLFQRVKAKRPLWTLPRLSPEFKGAIPIFVVAALVFVCCYGIVQTSLLQNPDGFFDGIFRSLVYWWGQHSVERLTGPTTFHLRSMLLHELPLSLVVLFFSIRNFGWRPARMIVLSGLLVLFLITIPVPWRTFEYAPGGLRALLQFLKIRASADIFLYAMCFAFGILGTWILFDEGQWFTGLLNYWTFTALAIYSFAGEKTPWLTLHVMYPAALLGSVAVARWSESLELKPWLTWRAYRSKVNRNQAIAMGLAVLALAYQLRLSYFVNFVTPGEPRDLLSQVHNTKDVKFVMDWMNRISYETGEKPVRMPIAIVGDVVWAFYFHLIEYGYKNFVLDDAHVNGTQRFVILDEKYDKVLGSKLLGWGYRLSKLDHSGWWVPEHGPVSWSDWVVYAWSRRPPNPVGLTPLFVYFKPLDDNRALSSAGQPTAGQPTSPAKP